MSGASYRIEVTHNPSPGTPYVWVAYITRLSDEKLLGGDVGVTPDEAEKRARQMVKGWSGQNTYLVLVDDEGNDVHSVKA